MLLILQPFYGMAYTLVSPHRGLTIDGVKTLPNLPDVMLFFTTATQICERNAPAAKLDLLHLFFAVSYKSLISVLQENTQKF
jgi:hypothetical protein